ncbi:MAG: AbrB/MazE/SpoVT family DNA-binding domain-containing protein [Actinomycetota bacterium]
MTLKVGPKGQIVISKEIREQMGIKPGWAAIERQAGDHLEVYFVPPEHKKSLKGSLLPYIKTSIADSKEWNQSRKHAWDEAVKKDYGRKPS